MHSRRLTFQMNNPFWGIILIISFWSHLANAQISGVVKDARSGKTLTGAEVFVNHSTLFDETDEQGNFNLSTPPYGFITLVVYKEGYESYYSNMRVQPERAYTLALTLTPESKKSEPVKISLADNIQTGYRTINYFLQSATDSDIVRYQNLSSSGLSQDIAWEKSRKELYHGSLRHWLTTMIDGTSSKEGFEVQNNGKPFLQESMISQTSLSGYYRLSLPATIEVKYKASASKLTASGALDVSERGVLLNPKLLTVIGPMQRSLLPLDFEPIEGDVEEVYAEMVKRYYEKIYVHTDKPYYYQGEAMWFKAYVNYYYPQWRDSLSKVLYVELISPKKEIVLEKVLKIDSGYAAGDFILPDTLKQGDYFLRAYTNLQRNFGNETLYVKHISILGITDKVDPSLANWEPLSDKRVTILTDKQNYKPRDKVTLTVAIDDGKGNPIKSNLSVSVTDASQVVPVKIPTIKDNYKIESNEIDIPQILSYQPEEGVTFRGIYFNEKGVPSKELLNLVQWNSNNMALIETEEDGRFEVSGFNFYDSTRIFYNSPDGKESRGKIKLEAKDKPYVGDYSEVAQALKLLSTESPQRIISNYEVPQDVKLLENIDITASQLNDQRVERPYGIARQVDVIQKKEIKVEMGNLNFSLIGKVPGLLVQQVDGGWNVKILRATGLSGAGGEPMVTVNDVPMSGNAGDILSMIDPATVESIEIKKSINVMYGSQGAFGVIAVYTQALKGNSKRNPLPTAQNFKARGFSLPRKFSYPDHSKKSDQVDLRSGLYWNPLLVPDAETGRTSVSFYASDLETSYRIVVEGVTAANEPLHAEYFITIDND